MNLFKELERVSLTTRKNPNFVTLTLRVVPNIHEQLQELAKELDRPQNWVLTHLILLARQQMKEDRN